MKATILYTQRSAKTGKALFNYLSNHPRFNLVRRVRKNKKVRHSDLVIGWGNSSSHFPQSNNVFNKPEAINNASNKKRMMQLLIENNIKTPDVTFDVHGDLSAFKDEDGYFYVRDCNNTIRYDNTIHAGDRYVSKPVGKKREFRVHVFRDKILGIYEKIPNDDNVKLFKQHSCHFSRLLDDTELVTDEVKQMCIDAVKALGLDFGGVDLMKVKKKYFINEVNSSPSLSTTNIERYVNAMLEVLE